MWTIQQVLQNFFTHKDFLPPAHQLPGTLFTPLHILFSVLCFGLVIFLCLKLRKKNEKTIRTVFAVLWGFLTVVEFVKIAWESCSGARVEMNWTGNLPLYPCSIFMYAMPFAIWGRGWVRDSACGYVCSLGLVGGLVNFVYPANILSNYSCLSFSGFHTFAYHGTLVLCAGVMLLSGYHRLTGITRWQQLLQPALPFLAVSLIANAVNFSPIGADYMFFKLNSFIFAPLGAALPTLVCVVLAYGAYLLIHALPYLPSFIANRRAKAKTL